MANFIDLAEENACPVCLEQGGGEWKRLPCGCVLHSNCAADWFRTNPSCPTCRHTPHTPGGSRRRAAPADETIDDFLDMLPPDIQDDIRRADAQRTYVRTMQRAGSAPEPARAVTLELDSESESEREREPRRARGDDPSEPRRLRARGLTGESAR